MHRGDHAVLSLSLLLTSLLIVVIMFVIVVIIIFVAIPGFILIYQVRSFEMDQPHLYITNHLRAVQERRLIYKNQFH